MEGGGEILRCKDNKMKKQEKREEREQKERNDNNNNNKIDKTSKNKKETLSFAARGILLAFQTNNAGFRVFNILFCQHCLFLLFNCGCRRQRLLLDFVVVVC